MSTTSKKSLHRRILEAIKASGKLDVDYYEIMRAVWPPDKYPRAYRHSANGGPPGVAMVFGKALREMHGQGFITRNRLERFGQPNIMLLSGGRRELQEYR